MTERLLMAVRGEEAEPVVVETDEETGTAILHLDDGEDVILELSELRAAVEREAA